MGIKQLLLKGDGLKKQSTVPRHRDGSRRENNFTMEQNSIYLQFTDASSTGNERHKLQQQSDTVLPLLFSFELTVQVATLIRRKLVENIGVLKV